MAKVTSKLQVTIPKAIADRYRIRPGDEVEWIPAGETIRVVPPGARAEPLSVEARLRIFDEATARQERRQAAAGVRPSKGGRGWTREDLYRRGRTG